MKTPQNEVDVMDALAAGGTLAELEAVIVEKHKEEVKPAPIMTEYVISASANNTLNIAQYTSAKRDIFMSKKIFIDDSIGDAKVFEILRNETRKLQALVEAQLASIIAQATAPEALNNAEWCKIHKTIFNKFLGITKKLYGIEDKVADANPPPAA